MTNRGRMQLTGLKQLVENLERQGNVVAPTAMRSALGAAAKVVAAEARKGLRVGRGKQSGLLRQSIATKVSKANNPKQYALIGPRRGMEQTVSVPNRTSKGKRTGTTRLVLRNPTRYAHLVELGTAPHAIKGHQHPGAKPEPFLFPALESKRAEVMGIIEEKLSAGLTK